MFGACWRSSTVAFQCLASFSFVGAMRSNEPEDNFPRWERDSANAASMMTANPSDHCSDNDNDVDENCLMIIIG